MKTKAEQTAEIERLLSKYDARLAAEFLRGVQRVQDSLTLTAIEDALKRGGITPAMSLLQDALVAAGFVGFTGALQEALIAGGMMSQSIAAASRVDFAFSVGDNLTARFIETYRADKIRQIGDEMRSTISNIIQRETAAGTNPLETARRIKSGLGLTAFQEQHVDNFRRKLETLDVDALSNKLRDKRFDPSVKRALEAGKPLTKDKIDSMVEAYQRRYINRRAQTVARTESMTMVHSGSDQYWRQLVKNGTVDPSQIRRKWVVTADERLRHAHAGIPALNKDGVGLNEPFKSELGLIRYPCDPTAIAANRINCRCSVFTRIEK